LPGQGPKTEPEGNRTRLVAAYLPCGGLEERMAAKAVPDRVIFWIANTDISIEVYLRDYDLALLNPGYWSKRLAARLIAVGSNPASAR
jgi:hypothetical protein